MSWGISWEPPRLESFHSISALVPSRGENSPLPVLVLKPAVIPCNSAVLSALIKSLEVGGKVLEPAPMRDVLGDAWWLPASRTVPTQAPGSKHVPS